MKNEWQPIDTAPKDGTEILAYCSYDIDSYYILAHFKDELWVADNDLSYSPDHWMPLPEPPNE